MHHTYNSVVKQNTTLFPAASVSSEGYRQTNSGASSGTKYLYWRSKVVPGLERVLVYCECGCGRTYDEYKNWSTALQWQPYDISSRPHCSEDCCSKAQQLNDTTNTTNQGRYTLESGGSYQQQPTSSIKINNNTMNLASDQMNSTSTLKNCKCVGQTCGPSGYRSIEEYLDCHAEAIRRARRYEAYLWNRNDTGNLGNGRENYSTTATSKEVYGNRMGQNFSGRKYK